jgi:hypothetical protein
MAGICTDWGRFEVPALWAMTVREDAGAHWRHITAWYRTEDLLVGYRKRLAACRDALIDRWPPERSPAARAFLGRLGEMIVSVSDAIDMASRNAGALTGMSNALTSAQDELRPIYQRWLGYEQAEADAVETAQQTTFGDVRPTGIPQDWRESLNQQARSVVWRAEQDFFQSAQRMTVAPTYSNLSDSRWNPVGVPPTTGSDPGTAASDQPSEIAPARPFSPDSTRVTLAGGPTPATDHPFAAPAVAQMPRAPDGPPAPGIPVPVLPGPSGSVGTVEGTTGRGGRWTAAARSGAGRREQSRSASTGHEPGTVRSAPAETRTALSGPVIGASNTGQRPKDRLPRRRPNPVGGVIGPGAAMAEGITSSGHSFQVRRVDTNGGDRRSYDDLFEPWRIVRGVTPVIEPPPTRCHTSGPGVIGIDR